MQALSFPLSDSAVLLWEPTMIYKFTWILSLVCLRSLGDGTVAEAAFFVALALIIGQLSLFAWVALALHQEGPTPSWQIKVIYHLCVPARENSLKLSDSCPLSFQICPPTARKSL